MNKQTKIPRLKEDKGFTLLEMMVVIMIVGLLASLIVPNILGNKDKADQKKAVADITSLENALEMYRMDNGDYPANDEGLQALLKEPGSLRNQGTYRTGGYIKRLPDDPWHRPYLYSYPGEHGDIDIFTFGSDGKEGGKNAAADIGNWNVDTF
jgi:general secretion pathway protein G